MARPRTPKTSKHANKQTRAMNKQARAQKDARESRRPLFNFREQPRLASRLHARSFSRRPTNLNLAFSDGSFRDQSSNLKLLDGRASTRASNRASTRRPSTISRLVVRRVPRLTDNPTLSTTNDRLRCVRVDARQPQFLFWGWFLPQPSLQLHLRNRTHPVFSRASTRGSVSFSATTF